MSEPIDLRILQANERTMLAWLRTGLALMAFGFVVARIALWSRYETHEAGLSASLIFGVVLIALGAACEVLGALRFAKIRHELLAGRTIIPDAAGPITIALLVAGLGIALLVYLLSGA